MLTQLLAEQPGRQREQSVVIKNVGDTEAGADDRWRGRSPASRRRRFGFTAEPRTMAFLFDTDAHRQTLQAFPGRQTGA